MNRHSFLHAIVGFVATVLVPCAATQPASAIEIQTVTGGLWSDPAVWEGGAIPGPGDTARVLHGIEIRITDEVLCDELLVSGPEGLLAVSGACNLEPRIQVLGGASLVVDRYACVVLNSQANPQIRVGTGSSLTIRGNLTVGEPALGLPNLQMIDVEQGGELLVQGAGAIGTPATVVEVPVDSRNAEGGDLLVLVDAVPDSTVTHARVLTGRFRNAIWPVERVGDDLRLRGALVRPLIEGSDLDGNLSAADSLLVRDHEDEVDPLRAPGSFVVVRSGEQVGIVEKVFDGSAPDRTALFLDREPPSPLASAEPFLLTRGICAGTTLQFLNLAQIEGAPLRPDVDESVGGDATEGSDERRGIVVRGSLRSEYASFRWLGGSGAAIVVASPDGSGAVTTFDHTLFEETHARYAINLAYLAGPGTSNCSVRSSTYLRALGPTDGDFGHWFRLSAAEPGSSLDVSDCAAIELKDDLVYAYQNAAVEIRDTWMQDVGAGNFVDVNTPGGDLRIERCQGWGIGQTPIQLDQGVVEAVLADNRWSGCGNQLGRNTVDGQHLTSANNLGWLNLTTFARFTADRDTVRWSPWQAAVIGGVALDTLRIRDVVFENGGNYTEPGAQGWDPASTNAGPVELRSPSGGVTLLTIERCTFRNSWRRGQDLSPLGPLGHFGVRLRGAGSNLRTWIRGNSFDQSRSLAEGVASGQDHAAIVAFDPDWSAGEIAFNRFEATPVAITIAYLNRTVPVHHNYLGQPGGALPGALVYARSPVDFRFNTVVARSNDAAAVSLTQPSPAEGNLFLSDTNGTTPLALGSWAQSAGATILQNLFASAEAGVLEIVGAGPYSLQEAEALASALADNVQLAPGPGVALSVVQDLEMAFLLDDGPGVDFVQGSTDPDGSAADVGYRWTGPGLVTSAPGLGDARLRLAQCVPNPFNPHTTIAYSVDRPGTVSLVVYDLAGRRVRTLVAGHVAAGSHRAQWDGRDERGRAVASGMYLYRLLADGGSVTRRAVLVK